MAKKKTASKKATKAPTKSSAKKPVKSAKGAGKKAAPKARKQPAKKAASAKAVAKVKGTPAKKAAAPKKVVKPVAKAGKAAKPVAPKSKGGAKPKSAATPKTTAKIISMDQARKAQSGKTTQKSADLSGVFSPLDDRILIQRAGVSDRTPGGLFIPETVADRPNQGKVVAVGRGHRDKKGRIKPLDVQLGDTVMYAPYSGSEISINGLDVIVLREVDVLAIMKS